jgi:hypothetical protein
MLVEAKIFEAINAIFYLIFEPGNYENIPVINRS